MDDNKYTIKSTATIFEALTNIDLNGNGATFVTDREERIVGIATDGDIRAALLRGAAVTDGIEQALNRDFVWCWDTDSREQVLKILDTKIKIIPVLDREMRLVRVVTSGTFALVSQTDTFVRSKAPARISFGGGGSDLTHYFVQDDGAVLNVAISLYCHAALRIGKSKEITIDSSDLSITRKFRNLDEFLLASDEFDLFRSIIGLIKPTFGFHMCIDSDFPMGSGLGGSSAVITAILGCFNELRRDKWNEYELAEMAFQAERINMGISGGWQDQYASVFGGFNFIEFRKNKNLISPLRLRKKIALELQENLVLFKVSSGRNSGSIHDDQKFMMQQTEIKNLVKKNVQHCYDLKEYLLRGKLDQFGTGLDLAWNLKREFSPKISSDHIDGIYRHAMENGALGGKLLGAGGGGFMLFYVGPFQKNHFLKAMGTRDLFLTHFQFDNHGVQSWTNRSIQN